jgi:hypothetical protein
MFNVIFFWKMAPVHDRREVRDPEVMHGGEAIFLMPEAAICPHHNLKLFFELPNSRLKIFAMC